MANDPVPAIEATRFDPKLLELLVCPLTKETLDYDAERQERRGDQEDVEVVGMAAHQPLIVEQL